MSNSDRQIRRSNIKRKLRKRKRLYDKYKRTNRNDDYEIYINSTEIKLLLKCQTERVSSILLTRLRHNCSSLNADLFRVNIVSNPTCSCGAVLEDAKHFFFECRLYTEQKNRLYDSLNFIPVVTLDLLVNGNADFPGETNVIIKRAVLRYIKETRRFT